MLNKFAAIISIETEVVEIQRQKGGHASLADVLSSIADDKSLSIFQLIGDINSNGELV